MPNISGLYSQSTGLPPSDWKIIQALRFLCSDAVFFRYSDFFLPSDVERLTNKQLQLYLRQEGLMVSGNKAQLVERILKHTDGAVARTFDEDIEDDDENMPSRPQVILRRSQPSMKVVHQATIMWSPASKFYLLMMQTTKEVV